MGKKKIIIQGLSLFLMFVFISLYSFSQELFTKELKWKKSDSIEIVVFRDKDKVIAWSKNQLPFSSVFSKDIVIKGCNIYIVMVSGCSGLPCWNIYIFKEKDNLWQLKISSQARLTEKLEIKVDQNQEKIIFIIKSGQIGELPFDQLLE